MKNIFKIALPVFMAAVLLFTGCQNMFDPPGANVGSGNGLLSVIVGDGRTLLPEFDDVTFKISIWEGNTDLVENFILADEDFENPSTYELPEGYYNVAVQAYNDGILVAQNADTVTVRERYQNDVVFILTPADSSGHGYFYYNVTLPGYIEEAEEEDEEDEFFIDDHIESVTLTLTPVGNNNEAGTLEYVLYEKNRPMSDDVYAPEGKLYLPPGEYSVKLEVESDRKVGTSGYDLSITRYEVAYIYAGLTTAYEPEFFDEDFIAGVVLKGTLAVIDDAKNELSEDYIPYKLYLLDNNDKVLEEIEFTAVEDEDNDVTYYNWKKILDSNYAGDGPRSAVKFKFDAVNKDDPEKVILGPITSENINKWGNESIDLEMRIREITYDPQTVSAGGSVDFHEWVAENGYLDVEIVNPAGWGLIKKEVKVSEGATLKVDDWDYSIDDDTEDETIKTRLKLASTFDGALRMNVKFLELRGLLDVNAPGQSALASAEYKPSKVDITISECVNEDWRYEWVPDLRYEWVPDLRYEWVEDLQWVEDWGYWTIGGALPEDDDDIFVSDPSNPLYDNGEWIDYGSNQWVDHGSNQWVDYGSNQWVDYSDYEIPEDAKSFSTSTAPVLVEGTTNRYSWRIPLPAGYIWEDDTFVIQQKTTATSTNNPTWAQLDGYTVADLINNQNVPGNKLIAINPYPAPSGAWTGFDAKAENVGNSVTVTWDAFEEWLPETFAGYCVFVNGTGTSSVYTTTSASFSFPAGNVGDTVRYLIQPIIVSAGVNSIYADFNEYTNFVYRQPATLAAPANFKVSYTVPNYSVYIEWDAVTNASTYQVLGSISGENFYLVTTTGATNYTYSSNERYAIFKVRAVYRPDGTGGPSEMFGAYTAPTAAYTTRGN